MLSVDKTTGEVVKAAPSRGGLSLVQPPSVRLLERWAMLSVTRGSSQDREPRQHLTPKLSTEADQSIISDLPRPGQNCVLHNHANMR